MKLKRVLSLVLLVLVSSSFQGCILIATRMDANLNPWLGKTKDERMKVIGPPDRCVPLNAGGEVCEWFTYGVFQGVSNEHHVIYTYDRNSIATEWNYRGDLGHRSSRESQTREAMKETRPVGNDLPQADLRSSLGAPVGNKRDRASANMSRTKIGTPEMALSVWQSPREIALLGFPLDEGASRQQIQKAILDRGGKLLSRLHSPERDEFESSNWIEGSSKAGAVYTDAGQLAGLAVTWLVPDQQKAAALAVQIKSSLVRDFGPATRDDIGQGGWPLGYFWETKPVMAGVVAQGKEPEIEVMAMFASQEYAAALPPARPLY